MNLSQLIVKLQVVGTRELEKVVKDLGKVGLFGGGGKPGVPGAATQKGGPAEQSKLIKALGADYEKFARISGKVGKDQERSFEAMAKKAKDLVNTVEMLNDQLSGEMDLSKRNAIKDRIEEATEAAGKLRKEMEGVNAAASGGGGGIRSGIANFFGPGGGAGGFGQALTIGAATVRAIGTAYGANADFAARPYDFAARQGATWGNAYNRARRGDLSEQVLLSETGANAKYDAALYRDFMVGKMRSVMAGDSLRALPELMLGDPTKVVDFLNADDPTGRYAQQWKEFQFEWKEKHRAANPMQFNALDTLGGTSGYERRTSGFLGSNQAVKRIRELAAKTGVDASTLMGLHSSMIGASGRGAAGLGAGAYAIAGGMDTGAVASMLSAGPRGSRLLAAVQGLGIDVAAREKLGGYAASLVGNPMMSMGDPGAMAAMLGAGIAGDTATQNRMALQNQGGMGTYGQMMVGSDAWGRTASFINANVAGEGLSLYAKRALAEIAKDPNKLAQIQAGTYHVSAGESALGLTDEIVRNWATMQGKTEMSRFLSGDLGLRGTAAGQHLAKAQAMGGVGAYLASVPEGDRERVRAEMSTAVSMAYGGMEGILGTDEAALGNLRVRTPGGGVAGGRGGGAGMENISISVAKDVAALKADLSDLGTAIKNVTGYLILESAARQEQLYTLSSSGNAGFIPPGLWFTEAEKKAAAAAAAAATARVRENIQRNLDKR